jgi:two-component system sensor histidine kinase DegS
MRSGSKKRKKVTPSRRKLSAPPVYSTLTTKQKKLFKEAQQYAQLLIIEHEQERTRISRELHDQISQVLVGINLHLAAIKKAAQSNSAELTTKVDQAQRQIVESIQWVHDFARKLRPRVLDDLGIVHAIRSCIESYETGSKVRFHLTTRGDLTQLLEGERITLFRITQEALANIAHHSSAKNVYIELRRTADHVRLRIRNDGKGFDVSTVEPGIRNRRLGIVGMRERTQIAGGEFSITSSLKNGTEIQADIPIKTNDR